MRRAARLLSKWATFYGFRKKKEFRALILGGSKNPGDSIPVESLPEFHQDLQVILAIHTKEVRELGYRTVEWAVLCGFAKMAYKHAIRWHRHRIGGTMELKDYQQEAFMAVVDAVYGYTKTTQFSTYVWTVLRNRMSTKSNKAEALSPFSNDDRQLLVQFEETRNGFNGHVTFDQVAEMMELTPEQCSLVSNMLTRVFCESQIEATSGNSQRPQRLSLDGSRNDYTALREGVDHDVAFKPKHNLTEIFERANLTPFEKIVLQASLDEYWGWMTDVAKKHKKSRMWITYVLRNAREKVKALYAEAA
jgi:hypothetical protein